MSEINTGALSKSLMPGVRTWFGNMYNRYEDQYSKIFEIRSSNRYFEEDVNINGFEMGAVIPEGGDVTYTSASQGPGQRYVHVKYGKGYIITEEAIDDCLYPQLIRGFSEGMGIAMKQLKETVHANILNRANNSSYTGFDGVELSSAAHRLTKGGTYSNELAVASNLSELSLEQSIIDIGGFVDDAGLKLQAMAALLIIPRQLQFEADRILESDLKNDTAENAINALKRGGYLNGGSYTVNNYLTSSTKWFVKTTVPNGLIGYQRKPLSIQNDTVFDSNSMKFKFTERYSCYWTDPRGMFFNGE